MATATAILDIIAPQFASDDDKTSFIGYARGRTSLSYYGTNLEMAVALRAAHMMTLRDIAVAGGGGGEVASKREGDLAIFYYKSQASS